ncbi:OprO/OprP family phosphate-selective porin [Halosquirtibacter xylanolyticus]|uniref:porin n=1 Tax=Halosquirtibacter xylanolyticus TaxID=3374599 RepID=UPI003747EB6E|nr:OprO/OprP family phosphate-selective porin [Prolixibacteraceae bacterium]
MKYISLILAVMFILTANAQNNKTNESYIENDLISLNGKDGISFKTGAGDFLFKPYVLIQTRAQFNYYDDEGLSLMDQDNVLNSGFAIPYALVGFAGTAFNKITYNIALNTAASGAALLNQAWIDINLKSSIRFRVGKFKTPYNQAYLVRLGQTLFPVPPMSMQTTVNMPFGLNSVNPKIATGFDIGVQMHGLVNNVWDYRIGVFNGTGIGTNQATKTLSDDYNIPSLLYAARLAYMPLGQMPLHQGSPTDLHNHKMLFALSGSANIEANAESSNDYRTGVEFAYLRNKLYFNAEAYTMTMNYVERQKTAPLYSYWGAYAQAGYFIGKKLQPTVRIDFMDRNSTKVNGTLMANSIGLNYFILNNNLKIQAFYRHLSKMGHDTEFEANDDDNGLSEHQAMVQLQFSF